MERNGILEQSTVSFPDSDAIVAQEYFPAAITGRRYYEPVERGFEREMIKRLEYWRRLREKKKEK